MNKVTPPIEGTSGQGDTGTRAKHARGQGDTGTRGCVRTRRSRALNLQACRAEVSSSVSKL